jgi:hypothetical protein
MQAHRAPPSDCIALHMTTQITKIFNSARTRCTAAPTRTWTAHPLRHSAMASGHRECRRDRPHFHVVSEQHTLLASEPTVDTANTLHSKRAPAQLTLQGQATCLAPLRSSIIVAPPHTLSANPAITAPHRTHAMPAAATAAVKTGEAALTRRKRHTCTHRVGWRPLPNSVRPRHIRSRARHLTAFHPKRRLRPSGHTDFRRRRRHNVRIRPRTGKIRSNG